MSELSETGNDRIKPGGNLLAWEVVFEEIDDLYAEAKNWASDEFVIENQEQADKLDELDKTLLKKGQEAEAERVGEKKPYDELIDEIQSRYNPYIQKGKGKVDIARSTLKALLTAWRVEQDRIKREAAEKARLEAEAERKAAIEAMQASSGDLAAREQAEQMLESAKQAEKIAKKADKATTTGSGLRTTWVADITDQSKAVTWAYRRDPVAFIDLALRLANEAARSGVRTADGFTIREEKVAR